MPANLQLRPGHIAYFSMEIALEPDMPTYSGGLGILAGDFLRAAADSGTRMIAVTLVSRLGYVDQQIDAQGRQQSLEAGWEPAARLRRLPHTVVIPIGGRDVILLAWEYRIQGIGGHSVPVILLDSNHDNNHPLDREITSRLYGGDETLRLQQEIVLGIGGARMLDAMAVQVRRYHLNESHAALVCLELLARHQDPASADAQASVRSLCCFTTHTPVAAGHDSFNADLVSQQLGEFQDPALLRKLGGQHGLDLTRIALALCGRCNAVSKRHAETARLMHPGAPIQAITNGVHATGWTSAPFARLFDRQLPGWRKDNAMLRHADTLLTPQTVRTAHDENKASLAAHLQRSQAASIDPGLFTIGFARRMTAYKRPALLFENPERLTAMAQRQPLQILISGKAHPRDTEGLELIRALHEYTGTFGPEIRVVYVPGYDMALAQLLVAGVDLWLNTPLPPMEASGTSGMKAALNGVPSLSVLDGWWAEGCIDGVTGWAIGSPAEDDPGQHADSLYTRLENDILPLYHEDPDAWVAVMRHCIALNGYRFSSQRMLSDYLAQMY